MAAWLTAAEAWAEAHGLPHPAARARAEREAEEEEARR
jgi:hypothetical protein